VIFGEKWKRFCKTQLIESMEPTKTIEKANPNSVSYMGSSMSPTLKPGDRLQVVPCNGQKVRKGDVIIFAPPGSESRIVHRVISVESQGIRTQGDNSSRADEWILSPDRIIGRVIFAQRKNRKQRIFGGLIGQFRGMIFRVISMVDSGVSPLLRPFYGRMTRSGIFRRGLPFQIRTRVLSFDRPEGTELQVLMGRWMIGRWLPGMSRWHIRRPFRLFVDEESLPENKAEVSGVRFQVSGGE